MNRKWLSRLGLRLAAAFRWQAPVCYTDYVDRDAERMAQELDLIRMRFPHHA